MRRIAVYVDVLIVVNFIISYLLLKIVKLLIPKRTRLLQLYLGAAVAATSSLLIFFQGQSDLFIQFVRFCIGAISVIVAFGYSSFWSSFLRVALFYGVGIGFSGAMLMCYQIFPNQRLFIYNGVFYLDVSPMVLIGSLAVGYGVTKAVILLASLRSPEEHRCIVTIVTKGGMVSVDGLIDTGNKLTEPFSGFPVVVVKKAAVGNILPPFFRAKDGQVLTEGIRIIPFYSIGGTGVMYGFRPERLEIKTTNNSFVMHEVYVAVDDGLKDNDETNAIVSILCFKEGELSYGLD